MSVLVVDDDQQLVAALTELLAELQLDSTSAGDGATALELLRGGLRPSVVLMDLVMPNTGGIELFAEMLADPDPEESVQGGEHDRDRLARGMLVRPGGDVAARQLGNRIRPPHQAQGLDQRGD